MRFDLVLGIARAESRLLRRLVRFWVFNVLAWLFSFIIYLYYSGIHGFLSSYSATIGLMHPRYLIQAFGLWYLAILVIGVIFMAFDVRARDERERVAEVMDSRPFTNLELVVGRFLGILFQVWWPILLFALAVQCFGLLAASLGWPVGGALEIRSLLAFVGPVALPGFAFVLALVFLVSLLTRHRLVTALVLLAFIGVWGWLFFTAPVDSIMAFDILGPNVLRIPSEMLAAVWNPGGLLQRLATLIAAAGLLGVAAAVHPRLDSGRRKVWAASGVGLLLVAGLGLGWVYQQSLALRGDFFAWKEAHEARRDEPAADLRSVRGTATIEPGQALTVAVDLELAAPDGGLERALFSLNPGLVVAKVTDAGGTALSFSHENGLLEVALGRALAAGEETTIHLSYAGAPDTQFAYLDAAIDALRLPSWKAGNLLYFGGYEPAVFDPRFVVLMPGIRWLPAAGADVGRDDPGRRPDFFELELEVDVPEGWLAAGPGKRRPAEGAAEVGRSRYRFAPTAPLGEAAIVASRFESRAIEIEGVELELLLHPAHTKNLEVLGEASEEIRTWLEERFQEAAELGLDYPYEAFTLVEVPGSVRAYGGGWRMDTTMAPPGLVLLREWGFPSSRFDFRFRKPEEHEDKEGGIARAQREALEGFFESDFSGSNPFLGAARSFFSHQTAAYGSGALALDYVCHELIARLISDKEGYFSAHMFEQSELQLMIQSTIQNLQRGGRLDIAQAVRDAATQQPEVWNQVLGASLADMDPWEDPARTVNVLVLKGGSLSRWLLDGLGREEAGKLLAALRSQWSGEAFTMDDLMAVAAELGIDMAGLAGDWLVTTELPGFLASDAELYRLEDEDGVPRYQVTLHLRNDEAAPGLVRLYYSLEPPGQGRRRVPPEEGEPIRVAPGESVEVGLVLQKPPQWVWVSPYLALNRTGFPVKLPTLDEEKIVDAEPFTGSRPSDWQPLAEDTVVVDDLDSGFSVEAEEKDSGFRLASRFRPPQTFDQGLPVLTDFRPPGEWSRRAVGQAWGKYRHTQAVVRGGEGGQRAVFAAELPRSGPWSLEIYMQGQRERSKRWQRGAYHLQVDDGSDSQSVTFNAGGAEKGWNALGEFELPAGEVKVVLSDETDGGAVVADAIRWQPVERKRKDAVGEEREGG